MLLYVNAAADAKDDPVADVHKIILGPPPSRSPHLIVSSLFATSETVAHKFNRSHLVLKQVASCRSGFPL